MASLADYFDRYDKEHRHAVNRLLHGLGIPVILAGILLGAFSYWRLGSALFVLGWLLLFLGHRIEGNHPAFFQGPVYFLVGPIWVARELVEWVRRRPARAGANRPT